MGLATATNQGGSAEITAAKIFIKPLPQLLLQSWSDWKVSQIVRERRILFGCVFYGTFRSNRALHPIHFPISCAIEKLNRKLYKF
jgi:hypothetical protein